MKVYLASSFALIPRVEELTLALENAGHQITVRWWSREYDIPGEGKVKTTDLKKRYKKLKQEEFYGHPETEFSYRADLKGVEDADAFIFVAGKAPRPFNGANVELGLALAWGKPCYVYGILPNSVMYWNTTRCDSISALIEALEAEG